MRVHAVLKLSKLMFFIKFYYNNNMNEMTIIFHSQVSQYLYDRIEIEFIFFEFVRPLEFLFEISLGDIPSGSINNVFLFLLSQN